MRWLSRPQADFETSKIALEQYVQSTYVERRKDLQTKVFVAEENVRRAQRNIEYSRKLLAKGYITELQLQADEFAEKKAAKELQKVSTEMTVLDDYTRVKMNKWLGSRIRTAEAKVKSEEHSHQLDLEEIEHLEEQIEKCEILSPRRGKRGLCPPAPSQPQPHHRRRSTGPRASGNHPVFPIPRKMQIKCKIPEEKVTIIKPGLPVTIRFDAFADVEVHGEVQRINEYPEPNWWLTTKEYETIISLDADSVESQSAPPSKRHDRRNNDLSGADRRGIGTPVAGPLAGSD